MLKDHCLQIFVDKYLLTCGMPYLDVMASFPVFLKKKGNGIPEKRIISHIQQRQP